MRRTEGRLRRDALWFCAGLLAGLASVAVTPRGSAADSESTTGSLDPALRVQHGLRIETEFSTPTLVFDFPGLRVGTAEYPEGPTGATVFYFPNKAYAVVDVRGGAPGTHLTAALDNGYTADQKPFVDAVSFAGGSGYGLEAVAGVMAGLHAKRNYSGKWYDIGIVPGAIIYDFGRRENGIHPDKRLGLAAFRAATPGVFYLGARGAGRSAGTGWYFGPPYMEPSGQGGAFRRVGDTRIAVFTVVNANGAIVDRAGIVRRGNRDPKTGKRSLIEQDLRAGTRRFAWGELLGLESGAGGLTRATTITLVVTNQTLAYAELRRLAIYVHTSMAKAIRPFHASTDGDTLFALSTATHDDPGLRFADLATHAAEAAWDAVLASIPTDD